VKVYIVYSDYGHDGCSPPQGVFATKADADAFIAEKKKLDKYFDIHAEVMESEVAS
jgi:hypothetical protein